MYKTDLAALYVWPRTLTDKAALAYLRRLIATTPGLRDALDATGYNPHQQRFTPRQVDIIFQLLGRPSHPDTPPSGGGT